MQSIYRKLQPDHIRLLRVQGGAADRQLSFGFVHWEPGTNIDYTAISYTWGDGVETETITVDGQKLRIRPNLWACLHTIRHAWRYIWADAICINQADIAERNSQVRLMELIYRNANVVSVWLGQVPLPDHTRIEGPIVTVEVDDFNWQESMSDLASRPYWSRCWVIQEFLLAQNVELYCSNSRIKYDHFQELLSDAAGLDLLGGSSEHTGSLTKWPALGLVVERHMDRYPAVYQSLYDILVSHPNTQSTDPRDRVFSLLGLLMEDERWLLQRSFPNYDLTEEQVTVVALAHVKQYNMQQLNPRVLKAMRIEGRKDLPRLLQMADKLDYMGHDNPAAQAAWLGSFSSEMLALETSISDSSSDDSRSCTVR